jgi:hypothetical protein
MRLIAFGVMVLSLIASPLPSHASVCKVSRVYHTSYTTHKTTARMHYTCK